MFARRLILLAVLTGGILADTMAPAQAQDLAGARQFVSNLSTGAIRVMTGKGISDTERTRQFRQLFIGAVDMPVVGKLVLGRYWRVATPEQRSQFLAVFEDILVYTWATRFKNTAGTVRLQIRGTAPGSGQGVQVDSAIERQNREPIPVIWHLRPTGGGWRIVDLDVSGTSMIVTYRDEYASYIVGHGGSVAALLDALRRKVAQLSQAPPADGGDDPASLGQ
ncbi:MAG: ABC transporter substrate-binding protein [Magnetospirillum sp.]|nr:ABC transporter substrate-binding protein [Magnetospirillum sp.]